MAHMIALFDGSVYRTDVVQGAGKYVDIDMDSGSVGVVPGTTLINRIKAGVDYIDAGIIVDKVVMQKKFCMRVPKWFCGSGRGIQAIKPRISIEECRDEIVIRDNFDAVISYNSELEDCEADKYKWIGVLGVSGNRQVEVVGVLYRQMRCVLLIDTNIGAVINAKFSGECNVKGRCSEPSDEYKSAIAKEIMLRGYDNIDRLGIWRL